MKQQKHRSKDPAAGRRPLRRQTRSPREKHFAELIAAFAGKVLPKYRTKNQRSNHSSEAAVRMEWPLPRHLEP